MDKLSKDDSHAGGNRTPKKLPALTSKTLGMVDLRLTRPPDAMRPKQKAKENRPAKNEPPPIPAPAAEEMLAGPSDGLFAEMTPEAHRRLGAMLRNFCEEADGSMRTNIDLSLYASDSGEVITNATVQELCIVQPNIESLNLSGCSEISDVSLWTIARHCPGIKHIVFSGCDKITNIGLRSLSLRCSELITLDFTDCHLLDDMGLTTVACGCWKLETLLLRNCTGVTDTGVGKVAKACARLRVLDLHGCTRVGEFGDHALKEIGSFCGELRSLDLVGCRHVHDQGLRALAVGCPHLESLMLSGCDGVSGVGIRALGKHMKQLKHLALNGSDNLTDADLQAMTGAAFATSLITVDLSDCKNITDDGVATLCSAVGNNILNLNLAGCAVTDVATDLVTQMCTKLRSLDLRHCSGITDRSVHLAAQGITGLTTLKMDGNDRISTKTIASYIGRKLEFAEMATQWIGYQPKRNSEDLIKRREVNRLLDEKAVIIQSIVRMRLARIYYNEKRRIWIVNRAVPRFQALFRGYRQRKRYNQYKLGVIRQRCALKIQTRFRTHLQVEKRNKRNREKRFLAYKQRMAVVIQRYYWGMIGRRRAVMRRNEVVNEKLREAKVQAMKEVKAVVIQCAVHVWLARIKMQRLRDEREKRKQREASEDRSCRTIQRIARGRLGRRKAEYVRYLLERQALMWRCARDIQRVYRGYVARVFVANERAERWRLLREASALIIERFWRGVRARMLAAVLRALKVLRFKQRYAATHVQRVFRGRRARVRLQAIREREMQARRINRAATLIQKLFRGHKGREVAEIERELMKLEDRAKPLFALLKNLEEDAIALAKQTNRLDALANKSVEEIEAITTELEQASRTTSKFTDSSRVNGIPQRFLTKYLIVRLRDHLENEKVLLDTRQKDLTASRTALRDVDRRIRATKRELVPLTTGLVVSVKRDRAARLRNLVRSQRKASTIIQALWRRAIVRVVYTDPLRDYWVECFDEEQGPDPYYYNTWSQETAWKEPIAHRMFIRPNIERRKKKQADMDWVEMMEGDKKFLYNMVTQEYKEVT